MSTCKLTDLKIKKLKAKSQQFDVGDGNGLYLRVYPSGVKTWFTRFTYQGKQKAVNLGVYPDLTLSQARVKTIEIKNQWATDARKAVPVKQLTFAEVYTEWFALKSQTIIDFKQIQYPFNKYLLPKLGDIPFCEITPRLLMQALNEPLNNGYTHCCRRCCQFIVQLERYALASGLIEIPHLQYVSTLLPKHEAKLQPSVPANQLPFIFEKLDLLHESDSSFSDLILMQFCTLLRTKEATVLRWEWVNEKSNCIIIPGEFMKKKRDHTVPISTQIEQLLNRAPHVSDFIYPSPRKEGCRSSITTPHFFLRRGLKGIMVPHGIRSMARTWMSDNGVDFFVAEACLAHLVGNSMQRAYLRSDFLEQRREPMQRWGNFVAASLHTAGQDSLLTL